MTPENLKILVIILNIVLAVLVAYLINAFCQPKLTHQRKRLFITLPILGGIIAALINSLASPPPANNYTYFILSLGYIYCAVALTIVWNAWSGSTATTSEAEIRKTLLEGITEKVEFRLKTSLCERIIIPRSSNLSPQHLPYSSNSEGFFPTVRRYLEIVPGIKTLLEPKKPILEVFNNPEINGKLLILGSPGSGKTTELLNLARTLCEVATEDEDQPVPIIFELSAWKPNLTIENWLISELKIQYNINPDLAHQWLIHDKIIPLLDGLDELKDLKNDCIEAINQFQSHPEYYQKHLVICSRIVDYETCANKLNLKAAVCLTELANQDIEDYLEKRNGSHLWQDIKADPDGFLILARIPLLLYLIRESYPQEIITQKRRCKNDSERERYQAKCKADLFNAYVQQKLAEPHDNLGYSPGQTRRYLSWLAKTLRRHQTTEFFIEKMQPNWLKTKTQWYWYPMISALISGLIFGLIFGLISGLISYDSQTIELTEAIDLSPASLQRGLYYALISGLMFGLIYGLISALIFRLTGGLIYGLALGLIGGLIYGLILGLKADIKIRTQPNQGIWESRNKALLVVALSTPAIALLSILATPILGHEYGLVDKIIFSLGMGVIFGLQGGGGNACLQHFTLRLILWWSDAIPWNYARFLSYASKRGLLKQSGGGYRFYHDLLGEHLA